MITPVYKNLDSVSDVVIETDDSSVPLDTIINVNKITEGSDYDRILGLIDAESGEMYDLKLFSKSLDANVTYLDNGMFKVTLPIPEGLRGKDLKVSYVKEDGQVVPYDVTLSEDGAYASFETNHFSIYTMTIMEDIQTGDSGVLYMLAVLLILSACGIAAVCIRRKKAFR